MWFSVLLPVYRFIMLTVDEFTMINLNGQCGKLH